jgi:hypothetical protein
VGDKDGKVDGVLLGVVVGTLVGDSLGAAEGEIEGIMVGGNVSPALCWSFNSCCTSLPSDLSVSCQIYLFGLICRTSLVSSPS